MSAMNFDWLRRHRISHIVRVLTPEEEKEAQDKVLGSKTQAQDGLQADQKGEFGVSPPSPEFTILRVPIKDDGRAVLDHHLPEVLRFLGPCIGQDQTRTDHREDSECDVDGTATIEKGTVCTGILFHCMEGVSRSSTFLIAYLMNARSCTLKEAFDAVKKSRPCIQPRYQWFEQLMALERRLNNGVNTAEHEDNYVPILLGA